MFDELWTKVKIVKLYIITFFKKYIIGENLWII